jgi:hypothetical protein
VASAAPAAKQEQQPKQAEHKSRTHSVLLWIPIAVVTYVLSAGPIAKLDQACQLEAKYPGAERAIEFVYKPLLCLLEASPPFERCYRWYLEKICRVRVQAKVYY